MAATASGSARQPIQVVCELPVPEPREEQLLAGADDREAAIEQRSKRVGAVTQIGAGRDHGAVYGIPTGELVR